MSKKTRKLFFIIALVLFLVGCSGLGNHTTRTEENDGFYQWGKGKSDWTHRY